jgi:HAD superfamily hydrolase (TIGR01549 family)
MNPSNREGDFIDFTDVELTLVDYFGTQGKSWTIDEAKTVQDLLGHRYSSDSQEGNGVDPRLRRLLDTTNIKDPTLFLHHIAGQLGTGPVGQKAVDGFIEMLERVRCCCAEFKDTKPALDKLKQKGQRLGVLSNLSPFDVDHIFYNEDEYHKNFELLVFSCQVGYVKPEPEIFLAAANQANLPLSKILFIDDEVENCKAARKLGMKVVLIDRAGRVKENIPGVLKIRLLTDLLSFLPDPK